MIERMCVIGIVLLRLLSECVIAAPARVVAYVDAVGGSDQTGAGTKEKPWRSVGFAVEHMKPGAVFILREGVYRERVVPKDGQEFRPFGQEKVVISGCDLVSGLEQREGGIFVAPVAKPALEAFLDGERLLKARHPDEDGDMYNTSDWAKTVATRGRPSNNGSGEVTFVAGLDGRIFDGGFFTGLNGQNPYQANMGRIVQTDGNTLQCDQTNLRWHCSQPGEFDGEGAGYITDHLNALTAQREWHWEQGVLHLIPPKDLPLAQRQVEARVRIYGFDCSRRKGILIQGLHFQAASVLMDESTECVIERCSFTDVSPWGRHFDVRPNDDPERYSYGNPEDGTAGIYISGSRNVIRDSWVARGWGALVTVRGRENTVENNVIEEANWQCREFAVNVVVNGAGHRILGNTLRTSTAMLLVMIDIDRKPTVAPLISANHCSDYGRIMLDGGTAAIYFNGNDDAEGGEISYNFITDNRTRNQRVSCGIYLDDHANNFRVHHNVVHGGGVSRSGLFTHKGSRRIDVFNNTFYGQREGGWVSAVWEGSRDVTTMFYRNNISGGRGFVTDGIHAPITQDHNLSNAPAAEFNNAAELDFTLAPTSTGIDAGIPIVGSVRVADGKPDLGAYERGVHWQVGADWNGTRTHTPAGRTRTPPIER